MCVYVVGAEPVGSVSLGQLPPVKFKRPFSFVVQPSGVHCPQHGLHPAEEGLPVSCSTISAQLCKEETTVNQKVDFVKTLFSRLK